jgi:hypothetical protein
MPYESLTCPKCGSGDCQEVKPGTYFCNHCDNVFRYVPLTAQDGGIAACSTCGIVAVGLCRTCKRYFCISHCGRSKTGRYDQCDKCFDAEELRLMWEVAAVETEKFRIAECIQILDLAGGVGLVERSATGAVYGSAFLGIVNRHRQKVVPIEPAWPIGDLEWLWRDRGISVTKSIVPSGITRTRTLVPLDIYLGDGWRLDERTGWGLDNNQVRHQVLSALEFLVASLTGS